jgi:Fe-S oxidoreductase
MLNVDEYRRQANMCVNGGFCRFIDMNWMKSVEFSRQCPIETKYGFILYSAPGFIRSAMAELDGELEFTPRLIDALYKCTLCGGCDGRCKRNLDVEVLQIIEKLKARCVEQGHGPMPEHKVMADNIRKTHNEYGKPHDDRLKWLPKDVKPAEKADIVYFVGCASAYKQPELAQATVKLLSQTGTQFMLLADEWCSGNYVFATGQMDLARELAEHNIEEIKKSGAKTVITNSAEVYKSLKVDFPKLLEKSTEDMPYTPLHLTEYLDQMMQDGKLKFKKSVPMKVTYHDPCNLGRLSEPWQEWEPKYVEGTNMPVGKVWRRGDRGIYDPPRNILKGIPGLEVVEMERARGNTWCAGSCGGVELAFPDFALWTAEQRIKEARASGAEAIVTCSPDAKELLTKAVKSKNAKMAVYDITEIMLQAI